MPVVEKVTAAKAYMRRETISYTAAYGTGRALAHLFVPVEAAPPHRVVVVVPSGNAVRARSIDELFDRFDFLVQAGHAVLLPVLDHTLERGSGGPAPEGRNAERDRLLTWSKDLQRALNYAETRSDLDATRVAYFGISMGAVLAPTLIAVEPRIDTAVLLSGGMLGPRAPEIDTWNYAPRVKVPVLMLNGRDDFIYPAATRQIPLFDALGAADKRRLEFEGGHVNLMVRVDVIREILQWIDSHLGRQTHR
jgi:dienelactone hydrolase